MEFTRTAYKAKIVRNIASNENNFFEDEDVKKMLKMTLSFAISFGIIIAAIIIVFCLLYLKYVMNNAGASGFLVLVVPPLLNIIQIKIFNFFYQMVALWSNKFENHKLRTTFEDSMVIKLFGFTFANTFNSFVIISFVKGRGGISFLEDCISP